MMLILIYPFLQIEKSGSRCASAELRTILSRVLQRHLRKTFGTDIPFNIEPTRLKMSILASLLVPQTFGLNARCVEHQGTNPVLQSLKDLRERVKRRTGNNCLLDGYPDVPPSSLKPRHHLEGPLGARETTDRRGHLPTISHQTPIKMRVG